MKNKRVFGWREVRGQRALGPPVSAGPGAHQAPNPRPVARLRFVAALGLAVYFLAGQLIPAVVATPTPVGLAYTPPIYLAPLTSDKWEAEIARLEVLAMQAKDKETRFEFAWFAHLAREGARLAEADTMAWVYGELVDVPEEP